MSQKIAVDDIVDAILCNEDTWNRVTQLAEKYVWAMKVGNNLVRLNLQEKATASTES